MSYKATFSKSVVKTILKYPKPKREQIYKALSDLPNGDIKRLRGNDKPPFFRLRIGNLRALFIKDEKRMEIFVFDIGSRGYIYK